MLIRIRKIFAPPIFEGDDDKTNTAALLNIFLLLILVGSIGYPIISFLVGAPLGNIILLLAGAAALTSVGFLILLRRGYLQAVSISLGFVIWLLFTIGVFSFHGLHDTAITGYFIVIILLSLVSKGRTLLFFSGLIILSTIAIYFAEQVEIITPAPKIPSGIDDLVLLIVILTISSLLLNVTVRRSTQALNKSRENTQRIEEANQTLSDTITELAHNRAQLTQQARRIERQSNQLETAAEVGRSATSILDPDELIDQVVNLIQKAFHLYYVGLFIVDERFEWAILRNGTGEAGAKMLARNHRIQIGEGMIGWAIANAQARVASQATEDAVRLATEELPETRSEAAIPLRARGQVIGALTVQDTEPEAFDATTVSIFQNMADQVAVALDNAQLFAESQRALEVSRQAFGQFSQEAWRQYLEAQSNINFLSTPFDERQIQSAEWSPEMSDTFKIGQITHHGDRTIHIPIILRDQTLGVVRLEKREGTGSWSETEIELMDTLVDQLETALETARLYSDTQRQAQREHLTHEVTDKLHRSLDMDALMQTLLQEISSALGVSEAFVQLSTTTPTPDSASQLLDATK